MKKVYVTVTEFIENGGKLEIDRQLFGRKHKEQVYNVIGWYLGFHTPDGEMIVLGQVSRTMPYYANQAYVEVDARPLYI